jgi:putative membrane protein
MVLVGALAILFAASNRAVVDLTLWPLPFSLPAPVYAVALSSVAVGVVWGGLIGWFAAVRARRRARQETRRADNLEADMTLLRQRIDGLERTRAPM